MDQGWATLLATVIALVGGTLLGGIVEARRAEGRINTDRDWQVQQQDRQWQREDSLAAKDRLRQAHLRRLFGTRDALLAALNDKDLSVGLIDTIKDMHRDALGDPALIDEFVAFGKLSVEEKKNAAGGLSGRVIGAAAAEEDRILLG